MTSPPRQSWPPCRYAARLVLDAARADLRWLAWFVVRAFVTWGAAMCGDVRIGAAWETNTPRPGSPRHERMVRRDVRRGLVQIEAHLAAASSGRTRRS